MIGKDNLNKKIIHLLKENPKLRDDFMGLLAVVWRNQMPEEDHKQSVFSFLGKIYNHQVLHPGTIERTWRQVQEEIPELRGDNWSERQNYSKKPVAKEVRENKEKLKPQEGLDLFP